MLSNLVDSWKRRPRSDNTAPVATRTISFPEQDRPRADNSRRTFSQYQDRGPKHPPRDADYDDDDDDDDDDEEENDDEVRLEDERDGEEDEVEGDIEDNEGESSGEDAEDTPLLPIFSSAHLDSLPVFSLTHTIRLLVIAKCDTVLTWEQLRSPQVSQFLVKPIQQEIKETHMSAATEYALIANCLQFAKEAGSSPGSSGTDKTRAMLCELIAIRLLKEYTTRELIDALSYDFSPLQGQSDSGILAPDGRYQQRVARSTRITCVEIAIKAQAKKYLSHPLVVQHLEAIWNGSIVIHAAADSMHRKRPTFFRATSYGTNALPRASLTAATARWNKTVTLYNPKDASLLKLSRLRVPRYRNVLSTLSFAVLLGLFLAVLQDRSTDITVLEAILWTWTAGYMLDEVIGFTDQGFSLYIASFWNIFDVGIMLLFFIYLCLRLDGVFMPDHRSKVRMANSAYDVLALSAILLFPRLFSVLDHYRYFSQLIIAFRMMAADMVAIFVLIVIFCSGFLVSLTFAFGKDGVDDPRAVAYALLQMLLGFTPAAWDRWDDYNWLGKAVLTLFLFVCHFVVVTILITVLTNSFMEIVRNANEEHQYLFAVNTISSVKSDALFAYVPPVNVLQWLLTPLRYTLPFREYVKLNRTIIKVTHFPILFTIYLYERFILRPNVVDTIDLVESRGKVRRAITKRLPRMVREPSIANVRQEAALEEVFRRPADTLRTIKLPDGRSTSNVVNTWMHSLGDNHEPPQEQDRKIVDRLERRRFGTRRLGSSQKGVLSLRRKPTSIASDPNDFTSFADLFSPQPPLQPSAEVTPSALEPPAQQTDADGDDELMTNDDDDTHTGHDGRRSSPYNQQARIGSNKDYFSSRLLPSTIVTTSPEGTQHVKGRSAKRVETPTTGSRPGSRQGTRPRPHMRNVSSATMIYNPPSDTDQEQQQIKHIDPPLPGKVASQDVSVADAQTASSKPSTNITGRKTPKRQYVRPLYPGKDNPAFRSTPNIPNTFQSPSKQYDPVVVERSPKKDNHKSMEIDLVSDIGDNKAIGGGYVGALPASFASQLALTTNALRQSQRDVQEQQRQAREERRKGDTEMFGRLMMARMNTLEEGFREVVHEVREGMKVVGSGGVSRQRSPERVIENVARQKQDKNSRERTERSIQFSAPASGNASVISAEQDLASNSLIGAADAREKETKAHAELDKPAPAPTEHARDEDTGY